jgi:transposase
MGNREIDYKMLYEEALLTLSEKDEIISVQQFELQKLYKFISGFKSERHVSTVGEHQLGLFELGTTRQLQEQLSEAAASTGKAAPRKRAVGTGRMSLPEHLERVDVVIEPSEPTEGCKKIGEEVNEILEVVPASFYVKRYVRPKYVRPDGTILIGNLPDRVIEKGIPSESVIAQMTVDKYVYGMPLHRQIDKYAKMGVRVPASTASDWIMGGWEHLRPLWKLLRMMVVGQGYLQVDESPIKVLDREHKNGIHNGYMWLYHAPVDRLVLFDYRKGRDQSGPREMLADFSGIIQTDGYSVYHALFDNHPRIHLTFCMAHARRKFVDAIRDDGTQAGYVLDEIQKLYLLETRMRENPTAWEERTRLRGEHARPILDGLEEWLRKNQYSYRPKSPMGEAIGYTLKRWAGLCAYALHGQMEIDNNLVENAVRPLAVGRKAYLFAGSHHAAEMTAGMYSFMASCKRNQINEFEWLKDVFERIQGHGHKDLYQLLPSNWEQYRPKPGQG